VALLLWDSIFLWPLRLFVVFLHEISHGLAAVLTGGAITRIEFSPNEGGVCWTRGGLPFVVLNAGYLGSLIFGAALLVASTLPRLNRVALLLLGALVLGVTLLFVRSFFAFFYGLLAGTLLLWAWRRMGAFGAELLLQTVGVVSGLYAVWDIATDVLFRSIHGSDASALARLTGVPAVVWGLAWIGLSVFVLAWALRRVAGRR